MVFHRWVKSRVLACALLLLPVLALARVALTPASAVNAASFIPLVPATQTWPGMDVPSLLNFELGQFADLSARTVDVRDYGARGDGATSDTTAVQAAIQAG